MSLAMRAGVDPMRVRRFFGDEASHNLRRRDAGLLRWIAERDRAAIFALLDPRRGDRALDVGCGAGLHARALVHAGLRVTAVDFAPQMVEAVRPLVDEARLGRVETLELGQTYARVLCSGVLDYVPDVAAAIGRLGAHVAVGGRLVITVPRWSAAGRFYRFGYELVHQIQVRLYEVEVLDEMARRHGLELVGASQPFLHSLVVGWIRLR
jgi:2-polyprenyl-3-methyl-5-hydroxy-6-metoxy-1,4-benzoquinol methylase